MGLGYKKRFLFVRFLRAFSTQNLDVYYNFYEGIVHFPCLGQGAELAVGRGKWIGHDEYMKGPCMESNPHHRCVPSYPYGIDIRLSFTKLWQMQVRASVFGLRGGRPHRRVYTARLRRVPALRDRLESL